MSQKFIWRNHNFFKLCLFEKMSDFMCVSYSYNHKLCILNFQIKKNYLL